MQWPQFVQKNILNVKRSSFTYIQCTPHIEEEKEILYTYQWLPNNFEALKIESGNQLNVGDFLSFMYLRY